MRTRRRTNNKKEKLDMYNYSFFVNKDLDPEPDLVKSRLDPPH